MLLHLLTWWLLCPHFCLSFSIPYNYVVLLSAVMSACLWRSFTSVMSSPFKCCVPHLHRERYPLPVNSLSCPLPVYCLLSLPLHPPTLCTWAMSVRCDNTHLWANHSPPPPPPPTAVVSLTLPHIPQLLTVVCPSSGVSVTFLTSTFPLLLPWHLSMSSIKGGTSPHVLH